MQIIKRKTVDVQFTNVDHILNKYKKSNLNLSVLYTNADSLTNKLNELKLIIKNSQKRPQIIAICEVKHKKDWKINLSELSLNSYELFNNDFEKNSRGIIIYVDRNIDSKFIDIKVNFSEQVTVELTCMKEKLIISCIYRSPTSTQDNDRKLCEHINYLNTNFMGNKLIIGDFNYANINWDTWETKGSCSSQILLKSLRDNYLIQHIKSPTRIRGSNIPHILDLVITNDSFIENIEHLSPLGKSDHEILLINCKLKSQIKINGDKLNLNKGDYTGLIQHMNVDWDQIFLPCTNNIDDLWKLFIDRLNEGIKKYIPKVKNFSD